MNVHEHLFASRACSCASQFSLRVIFSICAQASNLPQRGACVLYTKGCSAACVLYTKGCSAACVLYTKGCSAASVVMPCRHRPAASGTWEFHKDLGVPQVIWNFHKDPSKAWNFDRDPTERACDLASSLNSNSLFSTPQVAQA